MPEIKDSLEVDRLTNLVTGFGWRVRTQEFTEDRIIICLEKSRSLSEETETAGAG